MTNLKLDYGLAFEDLYIDAGLGRIDDAFLDHLGAIDGGLKDRLSAARNDPDAVGKADESALILEISPHIDTFIGGLFAIEGEIEALAHRHAGLDVIFACKRLFVQRRAAKTYKSGDAETFDGEALWRRLCGHMTATEFDQLSFAGQIMSWLEDEEANAAALDIAKRYAAWALYTQSGRRRHKADVLFKEPAKKDFAHLVDVETDMRDGVERFGRAAEELKCRHGFGLTDPGMDLTGALDEANYCIICHERGKDSCSRGMRDKKTGGKEAGAFAVNPTGITMTGCPLEQKISEMHRAKMLGQPVGALAIIMIDNPMVPATGHRICNDCMRACIYQKQDPVDIPEAETRILKDVLALPWGFEIYSLLTRWDPLNIRIPLPRPASGRGILVVGMGPAGFSLAHYLMNAGHSVVGIDGAKIEPLAAELTGIGAVGKRGPFEPVYDVEKLYEPLDDRIMAGFGGVAEYGITVRWNKNFLKIVRLVLERRDRFRLFGGVRFGGAITEAQAFDLGFDHIALCMGAGKPTYLPIPNGLAPGVRQASDFLMALQLTGAAKMNSITNLQIRMPVVVVGGGLTAIDTATEALAYYVRQVDKFLARYEHLASERGEEAVRAPWSAGETEIADEYLAHARLLGEERKQAAAMGHQPCFNGLLDQWGGAVIAYRRRMTDSPSYRLSHEEVSRAMEEGIRFAELLAPVEVEVDQHGQARALHLARQAINGDGRPEPTGEVVVMPARSILVAAGTLPNTVLARQDPDFAAMDGRYFQAVDDDGAKVAPEKLSKPQDPQILMRLTDDGRAISFFGDLHPSFAGNVVGAVGSAKQGWPVIDRIMARAPKPKLPPAALAETLNDGLRAVVEEVIRLAPTIIEVIVRAPFAAGAFRPGQFYRLQNFETLAPRVQGTTLAMEGLALTGAWVDRKEGVISLIVLEMGGSSDICKLLKPGEPVTLMGPTGAPTEIPSNETVILAGGGLGNAVLFSIGQAMRDAGSKVIYFAAYKGMGDRFHIENIEAAADVLIWCCDEAPGFTPGRDADKTFAGNVVEAMTAYAKGDLGDVAIPLADADRIITIGSDMMMKAVRDARSGVLAPYLKPGHVAIGSINSPMQCMMKEICGQCLQFHRDPETGAESVVFSCFNQDQPLDHVDFASLRGRLGQNAVQEKLTRQWIAYCLKELAG